MRPAILLSLCLIPFALLVVAAVDDGVPLLSTVTIPDDHNRMPTHELAHDPPGFAIFKGVFLYEDGEFGPVRALDPVSLEENWNWYGQKLHIDFFTAVDNSLILTSHGVNQGFDLVALDHRNGKLKWKTPIEYPFVKPGPIDRVVLVKDDRILLCEWNTISALSLSDGATLFRREFDLDKGVLLGHPLHKEVAKPEVVWGIDDQLYGLDSKTGTINWEMNVDFRPEVGSYDGYRGFGNEFEAPVDGRVVFNYYHKWTRHIMVCVDVERKKIQWEFQCSRIDFFLCTGKSIYVNGYHNGSHGMWCLDQSTGEVRWMCKLPKGNYTSMVASKDKVYCCVSTFDRSDAPEGFVCSVSRQTGNLLWADRISTPIPNAPELFNGRLYVLSPESHKSDDHTGIIRVYSDTR